MLHIIINPTAGNGRADHIGEQALAVLTQRGIAFEAQRTAYVGHATELARAAAEAGRDTVIAVGGDGTVLEVARGLGGTRTALGVIPAGTGNDVVKMLHTPRKPMEALEFILNHPARSLDAGRLNDTMFLNVCGTGFDVVVLDYSQQAKKYVRGMLPYLWGVIRTIFTYNPVTVTLWLDEEESCTYDVLLAAVANGRFIGGGMDIAPNSQPDDGLFDVVLIPNMPRWKLPRYLPKLLNGTVIEVPGTLYRKCRRVKIEAERMRMNVDGEIIPMEAAALEVMPGALMAHW